MDKIALLSEGARVVALHELPTQHRIYSHLLLLAHLQLPMSWTKSTSVYIYRKTTPAEVLSEEQMSAAHRFATTPMCVLQNHAEAGANMTLNFDPDTYNPDHADVPASGNIL